MGSKSPGTWIQSIELKKDAMKVESSDKLPNESDQKHNNGKVIHYITMSLDGHITKPDGDIGFLSIVEQEGDDYGYSDFLKTVDATIVGRKTY